MTPIVYPRGSVDHVESTLSDRKGAVLAGATSVELSIHQGDHYDWRPAEWVDGNVRTTSPVTFDEATFPDTVYTVCVRPTGGPLGTTHPVVTVGTLIID